MLYFLFIDEDDVHEMYVSQTLFYLFCYAIEINSLSDKCTESTLKLEK